jgi:DNA helicase-2/ATP-dependent DNA helicase PcrA
MMGYGDYLARIGVRRSKIPILEGIGQNEPTAAHLLKRLETLSELIRRKESDSDARFVLSTVHSSKGLEYDNVYLMDVVDRVLPEVVIDNPATSSADDLRSNEEDRRLFYVAATRAKNRLTVLTYANENSCFCDEFLQKGPAILPQSKKKLPADDYLTFCGKYGEGARINHKKYGEGTVVAREAGNICVRFADGKIRKFALAVLYEKSLTE